MIVFSIDDEGKLESIQGRLGEYRDKAPNVLASAINATARNVRSAIAKKAGETYAYSKPGFTWPKSMITDPIARKAHLDATIKTKEKWRAHGLINFAVSPWQISAGQSGPDILKGKILKTSGMNRLEADGNKAFMNYLKNGNLQIVRRVEKTRVPLYTYYALSVPAMLGGEAAYGQVKPQINDMLDANIRKYIQKTIEKGAVKK